MTGKLQKLYPYPATECPLTGLYLSHDIRASQSGDEHVFVYANFVASLDGRIAISVGDTLAVPQSIANERDWRLFNELAAQADVMLTSGRYLRDLAGGFAQEIFEPDARVFPDLAIWRTDRGLPARSAIAIISASLDFSLPDTLVSGVRDVIVITTDDADAARIGALRERGVDVVTAGNGSVCGQQLINALTGRGYKFVYSAAGPRVMHMLAKAAVLDRLYLTSVMRVIGGEPHTSIANGSMLEVPMDMRLYEMYLDANGAHGCSQLFLSFERAEQTGAG